MDVISNHYYEEEDYVRGLQNGSANTVIDELNFLSPNVKSLRYLVFRNRGFLYYNILKSNADILAVLKIEEKEESDLVNEDKQKQQARELFYSMIDDMVISLIYQEADEKLLNTLYEIFIYLDTTKLAKFTVEYLLSAKDESDDFFGLIPIENSSKEKYKLILQRLNLFKEQLVNEDLTKELESIKEKLLFLKQIKNDFNTLIENTNKLKAVEINIDSPLIGLNWISVIDGINRQTKQMQDKDKVQEVSKFRVKDLDPYLLTENPIERVAFCIPVEDNTSSVISLTENAGGLKEIGISLGDVTEISTEVQNEIVTEDEVFTEAQEYFDKDGDKENNDQGNTLEIETKGDIGANDTNTENKESMEAKIIIEENGIKSTPLIQRSSKRVRYRNEELSNEARDVEITKDCFIETERFFECLNSYLNLFNQNISTHLELTNIVDLYVPEKSDQNNKEASDYVNDFLTTLNDWNTKHYTHSLFMDDDTIAGSNTSKSTEDEKIKLMEVLSTFGNKGNSSSSEILKNGKNLDFYETDSEIRKFLQDFNESPCHYGQMKVLILRRLLGTQYYKDETGAECQICLVSDTIWSHKLLDKIKEWTIQYESAILADFKLKQGNKEVNGCSFEKLSFCIGIYEILVDIYVSIKLQMNNMISLSNRKTTQKSSKANLNSLSLDLVKIGDKLDKWTQFFEDFLQRINLDENMKRDDFFIYYTRYKWSFIHKEKSQNTIWQEKGFIMSQLQELLDNVLSKCGAEILALLPNYENINEISAESIKKQLTTTSILSILAKILYAKPGTNNDEAIQLLESILINDPISNETVEEMNSNSEEDVFDQNALIAIKNFLEHSPVDMKLSSWNILFLYYDENKQFSKFQGGFEEHVSFILHFLKSNRYSGLSELKLETLIKALGSYGKHVKVFLNHLSENNWRLSIDKHKSPNEIERILGDLLKLFELFYLFSIHEEAALISSSKISVKARSNKAYEKLKDIFISTVSIIVIYFKELLIHSNLTGSQDDMEHIIGSFICDLHEQLGWRKLCDSAQGLFLNLSQDVLVGFSNNLFEKQLLQLVSCRYHYSVSIDNFTPVNHDTKKTAEFDLVSTQKIAEFILPLCFKKDTLKIAPKTDVKLLVEEFYEVIGDPDFDSCEVLNRNQSLFNHFLESTSITSRFLRDAFYGLVELDFSDPPGITKIIRDGLYYMQGLLMFTSYKIRKKSTQSRAVELENIIMLLKNDLIYCTSRMESWFLLGQAYGFLVEDDLIWTSDKLTVPERKIGTANLQRKSLLCYLMAVNESTKIEMHDNYLMKPTMGSLMALFSKEMYNAAMKPMDMHAFKVKNIPRFIRKDSGATFVNLSLTASVNLRLCLKVIQQSLHLAIKSKKNDWTYYYYLAKVQRKLNKSPIVVLQTLEHASRLAKEQSNSSDPIIEPHYKKCSVVYKYVKDGSLSFESAVEFLKNDPVINYQKADGEITTIEGFYKIIVECLKTIISYDKKKWHHKPRYRLAKIMFEEFNNISEAKEEISSIVSLKASNKTLVLIWKPENERPGKHFYYTFQYALFYVVLLTSESNLICLIQMLPKLRRSNSIMVSLYTVWETLCSSICKTIRSQLNINDSFTERFMIPLAYQKFITNSKLFLDIMKDNGIPDSLQIHLCFLHAITDMKKLNNGFGPTSLIDDTMIAIFIKIYLHFDNQLLKSTISPSNADSPNEKNKKLAKRDFFPLISDMLKMFRRNIENTLKEKPDIYNTFVEVSSTQSKSEECEMNSPKSNIDLQQKTPELQTLLGTAEIPETNKIDCPERSELKSQETAESLPSKNENDLSKVRLLDDMLNNSNSNDEDTGNVIKKQKTSENEENGVTISNPNA